MKGRNEIGFRKCLEENRIKLRWDLENKESYLESCEYYVEYYDHSYGEYLPKNKDASILEIGCSFGWFLYYLDKKGYKKIFGIDLDPEKIAYVNRFGIKKAKNIDAFDFLKDKKDRYDLIAVTYVLEHIPKSKIFKFLNLIYESLRKGGRIVVTVPNMESPLNLRLRYLDFTHELSFTVNSLLHVLYYSNFDDLRIKDTFIIPKEKERKKRCLEAVNFLEKLYNDLGVRPPAFFGEGLICVGIKRGDSP